METLPIIVPGKIVLLSAPAKDTTLTIAARMALAGPVYVLDAGNQFDAYWVARLVRQQVVTVEPVLNRIHVARAFTCYQVVTLFEQTVCTAVPCLVLDLLATFYDENVPLSESHRLLQVVLGHLKRLCQAVPVVLSVSAPRLTERACLAQAVTDVADHLFTWETPVSVAPTRLL